VGLVPVAPSPLSLLDDGLDRRLCRGKVGNRNKLGPPEVPLGSLGFERPDEDPPLSVLLDQALEAPLNPPVEVTEGDTASLASSSSGASFSMPSGRS
jgi:hypothetical protein